MILNKVGGEVCIEKVTFESTPAGGEGSTHVDIWGGADQAEGTQVPMSGGWKAPAVLEDQQGAQGGGSE